ncbi:YlbG family protein [Streptococcus suis]|uniref:YlbG family protein n=1 Tax=Streptococcus suis TaxID=1307 RepID=UPI0005CCA6F6|nr:YlbG family protein [Streptococcus suis]MDY7284571.1 YlbG family protein [Streptococcus suis]NQG77739.1 YlbG family protein [Streptococcus suis]NQH60693.1 YlbG family protein [Streptococcus suis]NQN48593.1 YlbG family protein [Streptococcus suis]NQN56627.1 YlbG family protein [Streptococcus suis]
MFEKKNRTCLTVYLHYNRDARKLSQYGDIVYHSKRLRYVLVYMDQELVEATILKLKKERFVKKVFPSYIKELDQNFVGNLWRDEEPSVVG